MPPPRMRQSSGCRSASSARIRKTPTTEIAGIDEPEQKDRRPAEEAREPARRAGDREDAERQREAAEHLHQAEFSADVVLGARVSGVIGAWHDLGRHRVRDHVLDQRSDHDQQRAEQIGLLRLRELQRAGGRGREDKHAAGRERGADQDVGAALRAEDRDTVDKLAEDHLHGPRQAQPYAETGKLGRAELETFLDPHVARDVDEPERPIREIDHDQREVAAAGIRGSAAGSRRATAPGPCRPWVPERSGSVGRWRRSRDAVLPHLPPRRDRIDRLDHAFPRRVDLVHHVGDDAAVVRDDADHLADLRLLRQAERSTMPCSSEKPVTCASGYSTMRPKPLA